MAKEPTLRERIESMGFRRAEDGFFRSNNLKRIDEAMVRMYDGEIRAIVVFPGNDYDLRGDIYILP